MKKEDTIRSTKNRLQIFLIEICFICFIQAGFFPDTAGASTFRFPEPNPPVSIIEKADKHPVIKKHPKTGTPMEWTYHKTADNLHPSAIEQQMVWLMNRARAHPTDEGIWLATSQDPRIAGGREYFEVNTQLLQNEFAGYAAKPPAAFDVRLYNAANAHSMDLIARDAQDHNGQLEAIEASGFSYTQARINVFSYGEDGINAHAAFNIDWGNDTDGMQAGRGHRQAIMSLDEDYTNVGIASVSDTNLANNVGPEVITGNFCYANPYEPNHYNQFIIGTVWEDLNNNGMYDPGEGKPGVTVMPDQGDYYAVTADSGGFAFPATVSGIYNIHFSGNTVPDRISTVSVNGSSVLLDDLVSQSAVTIPGDINNDNMVNLTDLMIALQICAGLENLPHVNPAADTDDDQRIGLSDALYIFNNIAGGEPIASGLIKSAVPYDANPAYTASDMDALVSGFSEFTMDFYHALANDPAMNGENLFFSAYSIENALAMTWAGAKNQTAVQMADTLHFVLPPEQFHPTLNALNMDINSRDDQAPPSGDAFALNLVNALWSRIGYPFLPSYLDVIATNYDAGVRVLDFAGNPEDSRQTINQWVEDQTNRKIKNLLPVGSISPDTTVVLTNAIYFKGSWYRQFEESLTAPGPFTRLDESIVTANMMHQTMDARYLHNDAFDAIELPYASPMFSQWQYPEELSMLVIIPHAGQFAAVENALDKNRIDAIIDALSMEDIHFIFPKFEFECSIPCKDILENLGMRDAFDSRNADFSGMVRPADSRPWIDQIYHKAFVSVDESGTEAAAATAVVMTETAIAEPVILSADKPFIFLIQDHITHSILFMGRVLDPVS